ncbi:MAG TPA: tetratricopeptide repeat protein, partial [Myxococcota bacterium]|nr:tetratricopeptide repeat protein [Myxococcota bacterium]
MGWFGKPKYNRAESMSRAAKAEGRGKRKKAIAEYRKVLAQEPDNPVILVKLAGLLARTKQLDEARLKFLGAAEIYEKQEFDDKAVAVYRQAVSHLPKRIELWERLAQLDVKRERPPEAIRDLLEGASQFRRRKERQSAVRLLRVAVRIEPWQFEATLRLAGLLAKEGARPEARRLYEGLCEKNRAVRLRKVRGAMFRMSPTPAAAWRWARAALR